MSILNRALPCLILTVARVEGWSSQMVGLALLCGGFKSLGLVDDRAVFTKKYTASFATGYHHSSYDLKRTLAWVAAEQLACGDSSQS